MECRYEGAYNVCIYSNRPGLGKSDTINCTIVRIKGNILTTNEVDKDFLPPVKGDQIENPLDAFSFLK